jgi:hypothetical protein
VRVLICGSRTWTDREKIRSLIRELPYHAVVIHGDHWRGADAIADQEARKAGLRVEVYPAEWGVFGKRAGPKRNERMVVQGKPEFCFAFRMPGESAGTDDCVRRCKREGVNTHIITPEGEADAELAYEQLGIEVD